MSNVIVASLLVCVWLTILTTCLAILAGRVIRAIINAKQAELEARLEAAIRDWIEPQAEGKPSKFAQVLQAGGEIIGSAAAKSIMAALYADKSHAARAANGLSDEIEGAQNPLLGLLTGGKRGKGAAIARLASLIGPMLGGGGNHSGGESSDVPPRRHRD